MVKMKILECRLRLFHEKLEIVEDIEANRYIYVLIKNKKAVHLNLTRIVTVLY